MIAFRKLLVIILPLMAWSTNAFGSGGIVVVKIDGAINPAVAEFVTNEIRSANMSLEELIVIQMDTPGGLDTAMRKIIKAIQSSKIPVASFVSPGGSRAASAGTFIAIASHIAAMEPGTNIGAAHPVNLMGGGAGGQAKVMERRWSTMHLPISVLSLNKGAEMLIGLNCQLEKVFLFLQKKQNALTSLTLWSPTWILWCWHWIKER